VRPVAHLGHTIPSSDGTLKTADLIALVARRVPELTGNPQHPTTPCVEHLRDFPLSLHAR